MNSSMTKKHEQFDPTKEIPLEQNGQDFNSSDNTIQTNKNLIIKKNAFSVNDKETSIQQGQKIKATNPNSSLYSILLTDFLLSVNSLGVAPTLTLPKASLAGRGKIYIVKDEVGGASSTTITISAASGETIDGATTTTLTTNYSSKSLYCNGTSWGVY